MDADNTLLETALALRKQFSMDAAPVLSHGEQPSRDALKKMLAKRIAEMIDYEFDNFVNALYRIDIDETKVKEALSKQPFSEALEAVAEMIINRQQQKIITRKQHSSPAHDLEFDL